MSFQNQGILASAAASASYNMALQLVFRILTFLVNAFTLRRVSKDLLGVVNVRLMLLYTTTLFLAREAFRRAALSKSTDRRWPQVINLLWLILPGGILITVGLSFIWIYQLKNPDPQVVSNYNYGVVMFALSSVIELIAEPLYIVGQVFLFVRLKAVIEGVALALRCVFTVILVYAFPAWGLWSFCVAQVVHSVLYTTLYFIYFGYYIRSRKPGSDFPFTSITDFFPRRERGQRFFSPGLAGLTWSFFKQSALKQLLTEGEKYLMTLFNILSFADQGVYDIINNLGSLAPRFIFLPLEDAAYLLFCHTLKRGVALKTQSKDNQEFSSVVLHCLLKLVVLIGMTILIFGMSFSEIALHMYGGDILSSGSGPMLLRTYCFYVLLLAVNGITEAFVFSSQSKAQVEKYNQMMFAFSFLFLTSAWFLTRYVGSVGFILANCFNMSARIAHSLYYINNYFKETHERPLWGMLPHKPVIMVFLSSLLLTVTSMRLFCCARGIMYIMLHILIGAICFFLVIVVIYFTEQPLINFIQRQWQKRSQNQPQLEKNQENASPERLKRD